MSMKLGQLALNASVASLGLLAVALSGTNARAASIGEGSNMYAPGVQLIDHDHDASPFVPSGAKWGASQTPGTPGGTVTYSFMPSGPGCADDPDCGPADTISALSSFMPAGFEAEIRRAFAAWEAIANIQFVEVPDTGLDFNAAGAVGDIRIGGHSFNNDGPGGVLAHAFFPQTGAPSFAGDIHFDTSDTWKAGFGGPGFDIFQVTAHEIGHAIGLRHTTVPNSLMNPFYTEAFSGLQADDIAGAQDIYGAAAAVPTPALLPGLLGFGVSLVRKRRAQAVTVNA